MILPWRVDVPQDRWPVMNWLIILAMAGAFWLQVCDSVKYEIDENPHPPRVRPHGTGDGLPVMRPVEPSPEEQPQIPGITGRLMLQGWSLKQLAGHIWLHGGLLHLIGNAWFLWIFGNAVCAKIGNLKYFPLFMFLGVAAGATHLLLDSGPILGASGAINGVVGMYLVLFYENDIICYWVPLVVYWRQFTVSSFWMILFWLFWDVVGAMFFNEGAGVAYFAHLGGFGTGFAVAWLMCRQGWITMEPYERSLWQAWQQWRQRSRARRLDPTDGQSEQSAMEPPLAGALQDAAPQPEPRRIPMLQVETGEVESEPPVHPAIHVMCTCGGRISVSSQYAGRTVRCPHCKQGFEVTPERFSTTSAGSKAQAPPSVPGDASHGYIRFTCTCGQKIKTPSHYAGCRGTCPRCGSRVSIPHPPDGVFDGCA